MAKSERRACSEFGGIVRFAAGVVVGASLGCALASAATVTRHDGEFWKALRGPDKTAYVDGYHDAAQASLGKLDQLKVAASLFRWKGADKILAQLMRGLDLSGLSEDGLVAYLDSVYSNPQYGDFDVANAIELATMRGFDVKPVVEQKPAQPAPNAVAVGVAAEHR